MNRVTWLREKGWLAEERMDALFAPDYDRHWGHVDPTHGAMLDRFLSLLPREAPVLDAACGTGKYWGMVLGSGRSVVRTDHSRRMLLNARAKSPDVRIRKLRLQELRFEDEFDGAICVDAMENVPPEDWPTVLGNLHAALKADGLLYFTVETASEGEVEAALVAGKELGLPLVRGERAHEGGYHFYPDLPTVRDWCGGASFRLVEERSGDGYHHFLVRKEPEIRNLRRR